jgi:arylsulfatase A-like enzyme
MLPTICDLLDISLPDRVLDGISLVPAIEGTMKERPTPICFWHYDQGPEWKNQRWMSFESQLGSTPVGTKPPTEFRNFHHPVAKTKDFGGDAAIYGNRYKLIIDTSGRHKIPARTLTPVTSPVSLFDLEKDPAESVNVAAAHPEIVAAMTEQLHQWQASVEQSLTGAEYEQ